VEINELRKQLLEGMPDSLLNWHRVMIRSEGLTNW